MARKTLPVIPTPANLLDNTAAREMSEQLTAMVNQLAEPDVAWWYRNNRPGPLTDYAISEEESRPRSDTTVFFPSADVRGFYLPEPSWQMLSAMLLVSFRRTCEWRYSHESDKPMERWDVENRVAWLSATAWPLELLERREPVDPQPLAELRMHWGPWFGLLHKQLQGAKWVCPPELLDEYMSAVVTLRAQCSPANRLFLTGSKAKAEIADAVQEVRDSKGYREQHGI